MSLKKAAVIVLCAGALSACGQSTEPLSEAGATLTPEQVKTLNTDRSYADQRVAVVGYPMMCSMRNKYRAGDQVTLDVHTQLDCRSPTLASANVTLASEGSAKPGFGATGIRARNRLLVGSSFTEETVTFLTDDYKVVPAKTPVRVAGLVTYPYGSRSTTPLLESVSLTSPAAVAP